MKPLDFLMGVREFFIRLVPGALFLTIFPPAAFLITGQSDAFPLLVFAITAYIAGSVAADISGLLDRPVNSLIRRPAFRHRFAKRLAEREAAAKDIRDRLIREAGELPPGDPEESPKVFWWDFLRLHSPTAIAELDGLEAAQKMFRSLIVIFAAAAVYGFARGGCPLQVAGELVWVQPLAYLAAALICLPFYIGYRATFLSAVSRLAIAWWVGTRRAATPAEENR